MIGNLSLASILANFKYNNDLIGRMKVKVVLEEQDEGGFTVYVPSLPGCVSQGETKEEALKNIKEAIELYLEADTEEMIDYKGKVHTVAV